MKKKRKILVVDDNSEWLSLIEIILKRNYDLTFAKDPAQAKKEFVDNYFDLIILDKNIPEEASGLKLLKELQELKLNIPAIILTEFEDVRSAVESMKLGAADYVPKHTQNLNVVLKSKINEILEREKSTELSTLINKGESSSLEFKSSLRWDLRANKLNKELEKVVVKTVAAFMNSENESDLLIGVEDNGNIIGLQNDYQTLKKQDRDGFENLLMTLILEACGKDCIPLIKIKFYQIEGEEVCRVSIKASLRPIFVKDDKADNFFVRTGNSTRLLTTKEALEYCKIRWA